MLRGDFCRNQRRFSLFSAWLQRSQRIWGITLWRLRRRLLIGVRTSLKPTGVRHLFNKELPLSSIRFQSFVYVENVGKEQIMYMEFANK